MIRNGIYAQQGKGSGAPLPGATFTHFHERSSLQVLSQDSRVCGHAEDDRFVVAFKGFLHGATIAPSIRHDATAAAAHILSRWDGVSDPAAGLWGRFVVFGLNKQTGTLVIATDPYGSSELFRRTDQGRTDAATSIYLLNSAQPLDLNREVEDFLLVYGFVPRPETIFANVVRLDARSTFVLGGEEFPERKVPSSWAVPDWGDGDENDLVEALQIAFDRSIEELAPVDERVDVLLGGFDSALVAAGLAKRGHHVRTHTFRYDDDRFNQRFIGEVVEATGGTHRWHTIEPLELAKWLRRYPEIANAPTNWPAYVAQTVMVSDAVREEGGSVCFSGDGCDNLFFGYPLTYRRGQVVELLSRLPNGVLSGVRSLVSSSRLSDVVGRPAVVAGSVLDAAKLPHPERNFLTFRVFDPRSLSRLRGGHDPKRSIDLAEHAARLAAPYEHLDPVQLGYQAKKLLTPSAMKISGSIDAAGVTIVSPYQHEGMAKLAASVPTSLLRPSKGTNIGKYALAKMASRSGLLPDEVIYQPKMAAADVPATEWYGGDLRPVLLELVSKLPFVAHAPMTEQLLGETLGERAFQRVIGSETGGVANLNHGISLLATYGAMAGITGKGVHGATCG